MSKIACVIIIMLIHNAEECIHGHTHIYYIQLYIYSFILDIDIDIDIDIHTHTHIFPLPSNLLFPTLNDRSYSAF